MHPNTKRFGCGCLVGASATFLLAALVGVIALAYLGVSPSPLPRNTPPPSADFVHTGGKGSITQALEPILRQENVPALIAAVVTSDGLRQLGVVGVRKRGSGIAASPDNLWHLGSDSKAMTATLIARLVERGQLGWESRMKEIFTDEPDGFHEAMGNVTVRQLLSHRSGLPRDLDLDRYRDDEVRSGRRRAVREYLAKAPDYPPGTRTEYSNLGYIIAGAVVEAITGKSWESVMLDDVFVPLDMTSAGFGGLGTPGQIDQPWPHNDTGNPMPDNGPSVDNPPIMGPAGRVHCSIQDWAKFVADQLRGARNRPALLEPESYRNLQAPVGDGQHALGWLSLQRAWGGGTVLHHQGDNTMNHANVWIAPARDFAVLVCCNQGGDAAARATDRAVAAIINTWERLQNTESTAR